MTEFAIPRNAAARAAIARLLSRAELIMEREPDETFGDRYMLRWHLLRTAFLSEYLHLYVGSDPTPWLHDHPWPSLSLCLRGALREVREGPGGDGRRTTIRPGTVALRSPGSAHRIELLAGPAITLFVAGPRIRRWGWHAADGWRHWRTAQRVGADGVTRAVFDPPPQAGLL